MKRLLIVDDHPLLREGIERVIRSDSDLTVCGTAGTAQDALRLVDETSPDLVLTDLSLPGRNGLELIKDLRATHPDLPVLVLSMHDEMIYAERVLMAGARGYLMKEAAAENLLVAIHTVLDGGVYASASVTSHFLNSFSGGFRQAKPTFPLKRLTDRELEVFELIGTGFGNPEIGGKLGISPRTVDAHRSHIREKLGLGSGGELVRYAIRWVESGSFQG